MLCSACIILAIFRTSAAPSHPWLIVPGRSIGSICLGQELDPILPKLGPPDSIGEGGAAMGHIWTVYHGRTGNALDIYTVRGPDDSSAHPQNFVRQVRITSPSFETASGVRTGESMAEVRRRLPGLSLVKRLPNGALFDDPREGIAIQVADGRCEAIVIHPIGEGVLGVYLPFPDYS